jgi:serine/threonine-protein kinase
VRKSIPAAGVAFALVIACASARADEEPSGLFFRARELMAQGKYAEACPLLEESQRRDPGVGTEFNLARCYELVGRLASAWQRYDDVARTTHATGQSAREAIAIERRNALEARVAHLVVHGQDDTQITLDGAALGADDVKVDPGPHEIAASAPGKRAWTTRVVVQREAERLVVDVPRLEDELEPAATTPPPPAPVMAVPREEPAVPGRTQRLAALGAAGGALVAIGLGTFFGLRAASLAHDAEPHCGATCDAEGADLRRSSLHAGNASTVSFIAAGALGVAVAVLWLTAPKE